MTTGSPFTFKRYARRRVFQEPFFRITETVGAGSAAWAFAFGPFYYWKKGARLAAFLFLFLLIVTGGLRVARGQHQAELPPSELVPPTLVWLVFAALAPVVLVRHYERKGWRELPP
jgi:hypothetical protein